MLLDERDEIGAHARAAHDRVDLDVRGVRARRVALEGGENPGAAMLQAAGKEGADLLIMGAYSHSREHESIFGGATQHVVDHTAMPVVMVH